MDRLDGMLQKLPQAPPACGEYPASGGVEQSVNQDGEGDEKKSEGLIAAEEAALLIAAGGAVLLDIQGLQAIVHAVRSLPVRSIGSIAEDSAVFAGLVKARA